MTEDSASGPSVSELARLVVRFERRPLVQSVLLDALFRQRREVWEPTQPRKGAYSWRYVVALELAA